MSERCYKCGRRKCETCAGSGLDYPYYPADFYSCPDCGDGWREAEIAYFSDLSTSARFGFIEPARPAGAWQKQRWGHAVVDELTGGTYPVYQPAASDRVEVLGTNPDTLCPKCRPSQGFRDSLKDALAQETLDEEAGRN